MKGRELNSGTKIGTKKDKEQEVDLLAIKKQVWTDWFRQEFLEAATRAGILVFFLSDQRRIL
jgi:hypothetical protein